MNYTYIGTDEQLRKLADRLEHSQIKEIAVDFEGDYSRYHYGFTLCLVQIFDGERGYIIDPMTADLQLLKRVFTGPVQKVMFDPSGDLMLLKTAKNLTMRNVVDVQMAAKILDFPKLSLTAILQECLGVEIKNKKKFQTANWTRRPLDQRLLDYAIGDVFYLLQLKRMLVEKVKEAGKYEQFLEMLAGLEKRDFTHNTVDRHLKIKNAHHLHRQNKIYLKHFFECRERIARARDLPPTHVMQNETLLQIAQTPPKTKQEWLDLKGTHQSFPKYVNRFSMTKQRVDRIILNQNRQKKERDEKAQEKALGQ